MAKYPIKMLKDEEGTPFVPLVSTEALRTPGGESIEEKLEKKLEVSNIKAGTDISLSIDGNNITINNASKGVLIDNLDTEISGLGSLDAHQGKVLKDMIPDVVDNLTTVSTDKALSAYQGYLLNHKVVPTGGTTGQVLKKSSNDDHALEWGDAADPNAIVGDGSIKKIVELTYEEYQALETIDPDTEYHITDYNNEIITNRVFIDYTNSDSDTYSCNYINNKLLDNYSTEEQVIGKWINGKPLYRKVIDCGSLPNNGTKTVMHNISNLEEVTDIKGTALSTLYGTRIPFNFVGYNQQIQVSTYAIQIDNKADASSFYAYVTLEYTKTTD